MPGRHPTFYISGGISVPSRKASDKDGWRRRRSQGARPADVTGNTGSVVADTLLSAGKKVRVLVRDEAKGASWKAKGAEVHVLASLDDGAGLVTALVGAKGAYLLSPPDVSSSDFRTERRKTIDAVAEAIEKSGVAHVVFLSSIGAQHANGTGPIATLHDFEERLTKTSAKLTFVRAAFFLENFAAVASATKAGKLPSFLPVELVVPTVTTKDIGLVAANALLEGPPAAHVDVIELAGARDLSARDIAALFASKVCRAVAVEELPLDAVVPTFTSFGFSTHIAGLYREMYEGITTGLISWEGGNARQVRGSTDPAAVLGHFIA